MLRVTERYMFPESLDVSGDALERDRAIGLGLEECGDVVRQLHQLVAVHDYCDLGSSDSCCWVKSPKWRCQSDGPETLASWTAVTLYSGQLVAQSEFSVVTTFAPEPGW